jgi:hypothetical protein
MLLFYAADLESPAHKRKWGWNISGCDCVPSTSLVGTFHSRRSRLLKTGFLRQVRELKIQRKIPGSALRLVKLQETFDGQNFVFRQRIKMCQCIQSSNSCMHACMHIHVIIILLQFPLQKENPKLYYYHQ